MNELLGRVPLAQPCREDTEARAEWHPPRKSGCRDPLPGMGKPEAGYGVTQRRATAKVREGLHKPSGGSNLLRRRVWNDPLPGMW